MPKLPQLGEVRENPNAPSMPQYNPNAAGMKEKAIANAAGQVADYSLNLLEKRKKAADNDFAFKTYVDDYQAVEQESQRLKLESPEDGTGYAEKMKKFIDDRRTANEANATSDEGLRMYREKSTSLFKGAEIEAQNYENTTRAKYYVKSLDENANKLASTFLANPDYNRAKEVQSTLEIEIENNAQTHFVDVATREKLKQGVRDAVAMSVYDGLDAQERYSEQIKLLKNTDEESDIFRGMDAEKRGTLLRRAMAGLETRRRQGDADLRGRIADVMDSQMRGEEVEPTVLNSLANRIEVSGLRPDEKEKYGDAIRVSGIVASEKKRLMQTPISLWGKAEDAIPNRPDAKNARVVNKAQAALEHEMKLMREQANNDGAAYAIKSSPKLQQMSSAIEPGNPADTQGFDAEILSRQSALGISRPRILTQLQAQQVAQNFINQSPSEAAKSALALKAAHGKHAPMVFSEIVKDGKLPADAMLVAFTSNHQAATTIIENIKKRPEWDEAFKAKNKMGDDEIRRKVGGKFEEFGSALARQGTGTVSLANAFQNQVITEAKKRVVLGTNSSIDSAIDDSIDTIVRANFTPVKAAGGRSNFLMPRFDGNGRELKADATKAFVEAYSTKEGFESLDVAVPKDPLFAKFDAPVDTSDRLNGAVQNGERLDNAARFMGGKFETGKERFYKMLEKDAYWTPSQDNSKLILAFKYNGKAIAMKDSQGNVIEKSLHEISYDMDDRTLAEMTPWYKKMFKSNTAEAKAKK